MGSVLKQSVRISSQRVLQISLFLRGEEVRLLSRVPDWLDTARLFLVVHRRASVCLSRHSVSNLPVAETNHGNAALSQLNTNIDHPCRTQWLEVLLKPLRFRLLIKLSGQYFIPVLCSEDFSLQVPPLTPGTSTRRFLPHTTATDWLFSLFGAILHKP